MESCMNLFRSSGRQLASFSSGASLAYPQFSWLFAVLGVYLVVQRRLRYGRLEALKKKYNYQSREALANMTDTEAWEIMSNLSDFEFCTMFEKGLQFALFRTYGIPSISRLLVKTAQLSTSQNAGKRYVDTEVLVAEIWTNEPSSERAIDSFARLNYLHGMYRDSGQIQDDDMLYTLALFAIEPIKWIETYDWRKLSDLEKCAVGTFVKSVGDAMLIDYTKLPSAVTGFHDGIQWLEEIERWAEEYESEHMVPDKNNHQTANETTAILLTSLPRFLHAAGRDAVSAMMDERLRAAMMYPVPSQVTARTMRGILACRRFFMRYLALPRPKFMRSTLVEHKADEEGRRGLTRYEAHPFYVKPTLRNRWGPSAWASWFMGLALPGDDGDVYRPKGFLTSEVGPKNFFGKGLAVAEKEKLRLRAERTGKCPFARTG